MNVQGLTPVFTVEELKEEDKLQCRLCKTLINVHKDEFRPLVPFEGKNENYLCRKLRLHAIKKGHPPIWNVAYCNNFFEKMKEDGVPMGKLLSDFCMNQNKRYNSFEGFKNEVPWPCENGLNLAAYFGKRIGEALTFIRKGTSFKKQSWV